MIPSLTFALGAAGCMSAGDRARGVGDEDGDGCPDGEVCDPRTPEGLLFASDGFGLNWLDRRLFPVAAGGEMRVSLYDNATDDPLSFSWKATTSGVTTVHDLAPYSLVLRGASPGEDVLRIVSRDGVQLMDRITVEVLPIHTVTVRPSDELQPLGRPLGLPDRPFALFADSGASALQFSFYSIGGSRLIDQTTNVAALSGGVASPEESWDRFLISPAAAAAVVRLDVFAGGASHPVDVPVASAIDTIEAQTFPPTISVTERPILCFQAVRAQYRVIRAPWSVTSAGATWTPLDASGCGTISAEAAGQASVTATIGNATRTVAFTVTAPAPPPPTSAARATFAAERPAAVEDDEPAERAVTQGDRASSRW